MRCILPFLQQALEVADFNRFLKEKFLNHFLKRPLINHIVSLDIQTILLSVLIFCFSGSVFGASQNGSEETVRPASAKSEPLKGSLKQIQGTVLINHGKGYSIARLDMGLKAGDRVLTMDGARAVIVQADGCVVKLTDNVIFTLESPSTCQGGTKTIRKVGPYYARAIGSEAVTDVAPSVPDEMMEQPAVETTPEVTPATDAGEEQTAEIVEGVPEEVADAESGSFFDDFSTTQIVVTGVAVGLGLAVISGSDSSSGSGAVSPQ